MPRPLPSIKAPPGGGSLPRSRPGRCEAHVPATRRERERTREHPADRGEAKAGEEGGAPCLGLAASSVALVSAADGNGPTVPAGTATLRGAASERGGASPEGGGSRPDPHEQGDGDAGARGAVGRRGCRGRRSRSRGAP